MQHLCTKSRADVIQLLLEVSSLCACNCSIPLWFSLETFVFQVFFYFVFWSYQRTSCIHYSQTIAGIHILMRKIQSLRLVKILNSVLKFYTITCTIKKLLSNADLWIMCVHVCYPKRIWKKKNIEKGWKMQMFSSHSIMCEPLERSSVADYPNQ